MTVAHRNYKKMSLFGHFASFFEKVSVAITFFSCYLEKKKNPPLILAAIEKDTRKMFFEKSTSKKENAINELWPFKPLSKVMWKFVADAIHRSLIMLLKLGPWHREVPFGGDDSSSRYDFFFSCSSDNIRKNWQRIVFRGPPSSE